MNRIDRWFWGWLFRGTSGKAGYHHLLQSWLVLDVLFGAAMTWINPLNLQETARIFLVPFAGIFVGISVGWAGHAHTVLRTDELEEIANYVDGGMEGIVWEFQLAILALLVTIVLWGLAGLGIFDPAWRASAYVGISFLLYTGSSLSVRVCWNVVGNAQRLLVTRTRMRKERRGKLRTTPQGRRTQNNVTEPRPGTITGNVWDVIQRLQRPDGTVDRRSVMHVCAKKGINSSTAATQWSAWNRFHGMRGGRPV